MFTEYQIPLDHHSHFPLMNTGNYCARSGTYPHICNQVLHLVVHSVQNYKQPLAGTPHILYDTRHFTGIYTFGEHESDTRHIFQIVLMLREAKTTVTSLCISRPRICHQPLYQAVALSDVLSACAVLHPVQSTEPGLHHLAPLSSVGLISATTLYCAPSPAKRCYYSRCTLG